MKTKYYTTSSQFEGFYESDYYHSDMEYELDKHYELTNFDKYQRK